MRRPSISIFSAVGMDRWVSRQRGMPKGIDVLIGMDSKFTEKLRF
jgi:hypothetical protein